MYCSISSVDIQHTIANEKSTARQAIIYIFMPRAESSETRLQHEQCGKMSRHAYSPTLSVFLINIQTGRILEQPWRNLIQETGLVSGTLPIRPLSYFTFWTPSQKAALFSEKKRGKKKTLNIRAIGGWPMWSLVAVRAGLQKHRNQTSSIFFFFFLAFRRTANSVWSKRAVSLWKKKWLCGETIERVWGTLTR